MGSLTELVKVLRGWRRWGESCACGDDDDVGLNMVWCGCADMWACPQENLVANLPRIGVRGSRTYNMWIEIFHQRHHTHAVSGSRIRAIYTKSLLLSKPSSSTVFQYSGISLKYHVSYKSWLKRECQAMCWNGWRSSTSSRLPSLQLLLKLQLLISFYRASSVNVVLSTVMAWTLILLRYGRSWLMARSPKLAIYSDIHGKYHCLSRGRDDVVNG